MTGGHLKNGDTTSCGCYLRDILSQISTTHGMHKHPLYSTAICIQQRTCCPTSNNYPNYGGNGRGLLEEWKGTKGLIKLIEFLEDMEIPTGYEKYDERLTVDRINNDLGYFPDNLRWATRSQQINNRGLNKNNTSGTKGVVYRKEPSRWLARWYENGKNKAKSFNVSKFGYEEAFRLACEYRDKMIAKEEV